MGDQNIDFSDVEGVTFEGNDVNEIRYDNGQSEVMLWTNIKPFISTWRTTHSNDTITLPLVSSFSYSGATGQGEYDFSVDWGDGTPADRITAWNQAEATHYYQSAGDHTITISGKIWGWSFNGGGDCLKIINVSHWGCLTFIDGHTRTAYSYNAERKPAGQFRGCANLDSNATDSPTFGLETGGGYTMPNLAFCFAECTSLTDGLSGWDVSKVRDFDSMFYKCENFNGNLNDWNVSAADDFNWMFSRCTSYNQPMNKWKFIGTTSTYGNVSVNLSAMFAYAAAFNQNLSEWDLSNVTDMGSVFSGCSNYNNGGQPLTWKIKTDPWLIKGYSSDTNPDRYYTDMSYLFTNCTVFNNGSPPGDSSAPLAWDTSQVGNMRGMFENAVAFNQPLPWNVSNVVQFANMFEGSGGAADAQMSFDQDIGDWDVSTCGTDSHYRVSSGGITVYDFSHMFSYNSTFNNGGSDSIKNWKVHNANVFDRMFQRAKSFNQPIGNWWNGVNNNSPATASHSFMWFLMYADGFNQDLSGWQVANVTACGGFDTSATSWEPSKKPPFPCRTAVDIVFTGVNPVLVPAGKWLPASAQVHGQASSIAPWGKKVTIATPPGMPQGYGVVPNRVIITDTGVDVTSQAYISITRRPSGGQWDVYNPIPYTLDNYTQGVGECEYEGATGLVSCVAYENGPTQPPGYSVSFSMPSGGEAGDSYRVYYEYDGKTAYHYIEVY